MPKLLPITLLFLVFFMVLFSSNSLAVIQTLETSITGLKIISPKVEYYTMGQPINLGFQVYNSTNYIVNNDSTSCYVDIVNNTGSQVLSGKASYTAPDDWGFSLLPANITNKVGVYGYTIRCNNTQEAGYTSYQLEIAQGGAKATEMPIGLSVILSIFFVFLLFVAGYFTLKKHPLSYLFMLLTFIMADVMIWLNWRVLDFAASPLAQIFFNIFLAMGLITFIMFVVTFLDLIRLAIKMHDAKEAKKNITRFGYS